MTVAFLPMEGHLIRALAFSSAVSSMGAAVAFFLTAAAADADWCRRCRCNGAYCLLPNCKVKSTTACWSKACIGLGSALLLVSMLALSAFHLSPLGVAPNP